MSRKLLKSGMIVSGMTLISRVLGLLRDIVVANLMGAGQAADVFFFAQKIPNFLRRLFAEGAFAQAFVPVLTEFKQKENEDEVRLLIAKVSGTLGLLVTIVTLIGVIASPVVTALFGAGWFMDWLNGGPDSEKFELASVMLKITFPYLWFISFTALAGSILNTYGKFAVSAFTPVFLNVAIIACALYLSPQLEQPEMGLAWGVFFGGLIQFLFQIPFLFREKMLVKPSWGWSHPGVVKIRKLMLPAIFGVSVAQISLLLDTLVASFLITGSISWLYYSDRLLEFPLGLFGIAIATVILPSLSSKHVDKSQEQFQQTMDWGVRLVCLLGLPAMMGLIVLSKPLLSVMFMRGAFTAQDVIQASYSLMIYGTGLLSFMLVKVLAPGFYARQDTKTPVRFAVMTMFSKMGFNLIFVIPLSFYGFGYIGLAIATSLSASLNAYLLYRGLKKEGVYSLQASSWWQLAKMSVATVLVGLALFFYLPDFEQWLEWSLLESIAYLFAFIALAAGAYFTLLLCFGLRPRHIMAK